MDGADGGVRASESPLQSHASPAQHHPVSARPQPSNSSLAVLYSSSAAPETSTLDPIGVTGPPLATESATHDHKQKQIVGQSRNIRNLFDEIFTKRTAVELAEKILFWAESSRTLTAALAGIDAGHLSSAEIASLQRQNEENLKAVKAQGKDLMGVKNALSTFESQLLSEKRALADAMDTAPHVADKSPYEASIDALSGVSAAAPVSEAPSDTPSLLARYYDRKGDEFIFRERLQELDFYYYEALSKRDFLHDRGDGVDVLDEQFKVEYLTQRDRIFADLKAAEEDAATLQSLCHAAGYRPQKSDDHPSRQSVSAEGSDVYHSSISQSANPRTQLDNAALLDFLASDGRPNNIETWLRSVDPEAGVAASPHTYRSRSTSSAGATNSGMSEASVRSQHPAANIADRASFDEETDEARASEFPQVLLEGSKNETGASSA